MAPQTVAILLFEVIANVLPINPALLGLLYERKLRWAIC